MNPTTPVGRVRSVLQPPWRPKILLLMAVTGVIGHALTVLVLRWGHLYRQYAHTAIGISYARLLLVATNLFVILAALCAYHWRSEIPEQWRKRAYVITTLLVLAIPVSALFFFWVEGHGAECRGACGS